MIDKEKILQIVRIKGPVLPIALTAELKSNTLLASAVLSELVHEKKLLFSHTKIGGSPVYYLPEQRQHLQNLYKYLNEKDKVTFDLLKEKMVLRHNDLEPLLRVSLSNIKDFAVPLEVLYNNQKELFWKWYLTSDEEVREKIGTVLKQIQPPSSPTAQLIQEPTKTVQPEALPQTSPVQPKKIEDTMHKERRKRPARDHKEKGLENKPLLETGLQQKIPIDEKEPVHDDPFHLKLDNFFKQHTLIRSQPLVKKKNTELEYFVQVPTSLGYIEHVCIAYNKKKCTESDVTNAFVHGQLKKLPVIVLTTGEIVKKAQIKAQEYKNIKLIRVIP